jgi:hypothetical protein
VTAPILTITEVRQQPGGQLVGLRLETPCGGSAIVYADQARMPGIRDGHFTPEFGCKMEHARVAEVSIVGDAAEVTQ